MLSENYKFEKIKLVIWDLDNTLWDGVLLEGKINLSLDVTDLILKLTDLGIVNSICSKNKLEEVKQLLTEKNLWDLFVFCSINWSPKGPRIRQIIDNMNLRDENVLFIDDELFNLKEVETYCKNIMLATPEIINTLIDDVKERSVSDANHSRLSRYKILETKATDCAKYSNNVDFLIDSDISIRIEQLSDDYLDRVYDLIHRTNQLNYTKKRIEKSELYEIYKNPEYTNMCVFCTDKYGDYGLVGFYSLFKKNLQHFLFSCRVLGMGIEQYIYRKIGCPNFDIIGEVAARLDNSIDTETPWIHETVQNESFPCNDTLRNPTAKPRILLKGPCDISQIEVFLQNKYQICSEFTYIGERGWSIESQNHTLSILNSERYTFEQKKTISSLPIFDDHYFNSTIFTEPYDAIVLSMLNDYSLGIYRNRKDPDIMIPYEQYSIDLTDLATWESQKKRDRELNTDIFTEQFLTTFSNDWIYEGELSVDKMIENLKLIRTKLPKNTCLILINGSETEFHGNDKIRMDRHLKHHKYNQALKDFCDNTENCFLLDVNKYTSTKTYLDTINHYTKEVYYKLAMDLSQLLQEKCNVKLGHKGILFFKLYTFAAMSKRRVKLIYRYFIEKLQY